MRHHHGHLYLFLLLILPLIVLVTFTVNKAEKQKTQTQAQTQPISTPTTTVLAKNLEIPWALGFLPDGNIMFTERTGKVKLLNVASTQVTTVATIADVRAAKESGLLGLAVHPQFTSNNFIYVYYTYNGTGGLKNKIVRYTFTNNQLASPTIILDGIPGSDYHDGGRMRFGPDGFLYVTTGDASTDSIAQDTSSLGGKILRLKDDGVAAPGNPFNNRTWSYGHRNPQGLAWDGATLYATEHGPSSPSCCDELNRIEAGKNYGWPDVIGDQTKAGTEKSLLNSGQDGNNTWAPSGTTFYNGSVFWAGLKGQALYEAKVNGATATIVKQHFDNQLGRIRDVVIGPDNQLYIATSNKSAQGGSAQPEDDKIIKVSFGIAVPSQSVPNGVTPSFYPLAPCPTCVDPSVSPIVSRGVMPSGTNVVPSTNVNNPLPSQAPCETAGASLAHDKKKKKSKHKNHDGGVSNFMELLLKFFIELLNLILRLIGGGSIPLPMPDPTNPSPVDPEPCTPNGEPTSGPQITNVPSIAPSTVPSIAPALTTNPSPAVSLPASVLPSTTAPSQTLACVPSGQKCDATGARKCCANACVKNINPNFPNDPGTCD